MKLLLILLIIFSLSSLKGQSLKRVATVDRVLTELTNKDIFSGVVLIAASSKILLSKGYGYSNRELKIKNTLKTRFDLSSGSKIFTGTAITHLAQIGKLKFTDKIGQHIPGLPMGDSITIHQILTHSAGFYDFWKAKNFSYKNVKSCTDLDDQVPIPQTT